jgi:hypothetical protein
LHRPDQSGATRYPLRIGFGLWQYDDQASLVAFTVNQREGDSNAVDRDNRSRVKLGHFPISKEQITLHNGHKRNHQ